MMARGLLAFAARDLGAFGQQAGVIAELLGDDIEEGRLPIHGGQVHGLIPSRGRMRDRETAHRPELIPDELRRKCEKGEHGGA